MIGRFFQRFEERVGGADGHPVGVVDYADFAVSNQRPIHDLLFDLANLFDLDLGRREFRIRFNHEVIGMRARVDVMAGAAGSASIEGVHGWSRLTEKRLCEAESGRSLADGIFAVKEIGVRQTLSGCRSLERGDSRTVANDRVKRHINVRGFGSLSYATNLTQALRSPLERPGLADWH